METWETWKILIGILTIAVNVGVVGGLIVGKSIAKRSNPGYKPLLSVKERVIYAVSILLGTAFILLGVFYQFPSGEVEGREDETFFADGAAPDGEDFAAGSDSIAYNKVYVNEHVR